tara:strand:+ start:1104 stop:2369 length:1266 start_codon:yes stop_codon:yes gene_type:complete
MKLTKSQLEQIIKEEAINELGRGGIQKSWDKQEKEDAEWPELAGPAAAKEKKPYFAGGMKKALAAEQEFPADWTSDVIKIARKFEVTRIGIMINKMVDKKGEFMELIQYAVSLIKQDPKAEIRWLKDLLSTMAVQAGVEAPAEAPPAKAPLSPGLQKFKDSLPTPSDVIKRQSQPGHKPKQLPFLPAKKGWMQKKFIELTKEQLEEIIREEAIKILMETAEAKQINEIKMLKSLWKTVTDRLGRTSREMDVARLSPDLKRITKFIEKTKIKELIENYINMPKEFAQIMQYLMSKIQAVDERNKVTYMRQFIVDWMRAVNERDATITGDKPAQSLKKKPTARRTIKPPGKLAGTFFPSKSLTDKPAKPQVDQTATGGRRHRGQSHRGGARRARFRTAGMARQKGPRGLEENKERKNETKHNK